MSRDLETNLRQKIQELVTRDFAGLELARVALVLENLSVDYEQRARSERSSPGARSSVSEPFRAGGDHSTTTALHRPSEVVATSAPEIAIVAEDEHQVANLLHQIVNIGALMMQVDQPVKLNAFVRLVVEYEPLAFSMHITGRVVNISTRGTAIEIMKLEREDRAALEALYKDYQHLVGVEPGQEGAAQQKSASRAQVSRSGEHHSATHRSGEHPNPMSRLGSTMDGARFAMRRQVAITKPDEAVLKTSTNADVYERNNPADSQQGMEFYGPQTAWISSSQDPDRIEELTGERIMDILLQISGRSFSGMLQLSQGEHSDGSTGVRWQLLFDSGFLVEASCRPRLSRIEFGHMLLLANRVSKKELAIAAAHADEGNLPLQRSLLELDMLPPEKLRQSLAGRLTFLLRRLCNTLEGTVEIFEGEKLPAGYLPAPPLRVHVAVERTIFQLIFEKLRQLSVREREEQAVAELDAYPEADLAESERVERALQSEEHQRFLRRLATGRKRLREVFTESALSGADTFAILFTLHRMGLLRFDRSLHHTVVRERFRENVTVKYLSVHKASYFEVLNVHWSSYDEVIERAYKELIEQFDPDSVPQNLESAVPQRVSDIRERVESAYQVLARREHRHAYRARIMPEYKLAHAIPLFLKQCELAERRKQWGEARDSLMRVLEIEPDNLNAKAAIDVINKRIDGTLDNASSSVL